MNKFFVFLMSVMTASTLVLAEAEARRMGGGLSLGKQYSAPRQATRPQQSTTSRTQQSPAAGTRPSGASRWLGPLAGLAAGGLLASLFFGDSFEGLQIMDFLLIAALVFGGIFLFRMLRQRAPAPSPAGAYGGGASAGGPSSLGPLPTDMGSRMAPVSGDEAPAWFDEPGFLEAAKTHFVRLQAAWDEGDFHALQEYVTSELLAELRSTRQRMGGQPQYTEVVTLEAQLIGIRRDASQAVASVLFSGLIREERAGEVQNFSETWHVAHDWDSREGSWYIAGIQQTED
jgi:predicted lipid-binding transport protein (Tim44 family)